jgi:ribosomal protein S13
LKITVMVSYKHEVRIRIGTRREASLPWRGRKTKINKVRKKTRHIELV